MTNQQQQILSYAKQILRPKTTLIGADWADENFYLSPESSAIPGKWKTRPWQKEILDAATDQKSHIVVFQKPTRIGYSIILSIITAFYIHQRPSVQLHYQPNAEEAKGYAEDSIEPMIRDNATIKELIQTPNLRSKTKREKTVKKNYPGGYAEFLGAESDRSFNRRTARLMTADEIDAWVKEAGKAGDTITTALRRTSDFWDRKNILGGKPIGASFDPKADQKITDGISTINYWFMMGTQEHRYLPCPDCNHLQLFEFEDMIWDKDLDENEKVIKHYPMTAHFLCSECDFKIEHKHMRWMDIHGKWIAHNPEASIKKIRSFHLWAILSYSPNVTWGHIAQEFLDASLSKLKLKAFYNEVLARTWEEESIYIDTSSMVDRKENYTAQVPKGVLLVTAASDVQKNRIETEVIGWGANFESWSIEYKIFHGDTTQPEVWDNYRAFLLSKRWYNDDNLPVAIHTTTIDAGYLTETVTSFTQPLFNRRIYAIMGANSITAKIIPRKTGKTKTRNDFFSVGVNRAKDEIAWHIASTGGAGYMHFPNDSAYDAEYFMQLGAEKKDKTGRWQATRKRNEVFDVRNYNFIALLLSGVDLALQAEIGECLMVEHIPITPKKREIKNYLDEF